MILLMNIDNPQRLLTFGEYSRALKSGKDFGGIQGRKVTQGESHQLQTIQKILLVLEEFGELNTSSIKLKTGLYWNSIAWAKKRLLEKKIIKERKALHGKNNEKFYSMNRNRAIIYINHIFFWKKSYPRFIVLGEKIKQIRKIEKRYPLGFEDHIINVPLLEQKEYRINESKLKMSDLPYQLVKKIMDGYIAEKYCYDCFEDHNISETCRIKDDRYCPLCRTTMHNYYTLRDIFSEQNVQKMDKTS